MIENTKGLKDKTPYNISEMSEKRIREKEEELKIYEIELEELNEDIDNINKKIFKYNSRIEALDEDNLEELVMWLNKKSSCYFDLSKKLSDKSCKLKSIKCCKDSIELWK